MKDWTFKTSEIADTFDDHVREQLPWYDMATDAVSYITKNYLQTDGLVYDFGASTGNITAKILPFVSDRNAHVVAVDSSHTMADKLVRRFKDEDRVTVEAQDITTMDIQPANVYVLFLTLMFVGTEHRNALLQRLRSNLKDGGVIIIVDKVADEYGYFSTVLKRMTMNWKLQQGAKPEDVLIKEMSLAGVQVPISESMIHDGKLFFRMGEFAGWVIEK